MKQSIKNVLIAGVGGQGVLSVSEILSEVCMAMGFDVKKSEVHGMAQRGGSVVSHVRYGAKIRSPLVEKGTAERYSNLPRSSVFFLREPFLKWTSLST